MEEFVPLGPSLPWELQIIIFSVPLFGILSSQPAPALFIDVCELILATHQELHLG